MKTYKITLMVIDDEDIGLGQVIEHIENVKYPNYCIAPKVVATAERDIGEWDDDHPLNKKGWREEFGRIFGVDA